MKSSMMLSAKLSEEQIEDIARIDMRKFGEKDQSEGDVFFKSIITHCRQWVKLYDEVLDLVQGDLSAVIINGTAVVYRADATSGDVARVFQSDEKWTFEISRDSFYNNIEVMEGKEEDEFFGLYDEASDATSDACKVLRGEIETGNHC